MNEETEIKAIDELNLKQEKFCQLYATETEFFGNGVQSYIEAYEPDRKSPNWYKTACSVASEILSNPKVCARINDLLSEGGLNDQNVDKQLSFLITQHSDFNSKMGAIREYNKLKQRITEKMDHTSGGKPIPIITLNGIHSDHSNAEDLATQETNQSDSGGDECEQVDKHIIDLDSQSPE